MNVGFSFLAIFVSLLFAIRGTFSLQNLLLMQTHLTTFSLWPSSPISLRLLWSPNMFPFTYGKLKEYMKSVTVIADAPSHGCCNFVKSK